MSCEFLITDDDLNYVKDSLSQAALYEQMAEECSELSHALLKAARIIRNENPTPVSIKEAMYDVEEEYNDVELVANILSIRPNYSIQAFKLRRWINRINQSGV